MELEFVYQMPANDAVVPMRSGGMPKGARLFPQRDVEIASLYAGGKTLEEIGIQFSLSRERVRQIVAHSGVTAIDGGAQKRKRSNQLLDAVARQKRKETKDAEFLLLYGCSRGEAKKINDGYSLSTATSKARAYVTQYRTSRQRRIEWAITFPEWWEFWEKSGKWGHRHVGKGGYCLARFGDVGPYKIGNIKICSNEQNASESFGHTNSVTRHTRSTEVAPNKYLQAFFLKLGGMTNSEIGSQLTLKNKTISLYTSRGRKLFPDFVDNYNSAARGGK